MEDEDCSYAAVTDDDDVRLEKYVKQLTFLILSVLLLDSSSYFDSGMYIQLCICTRGVTRDCLRTCLSSH